MPRESVQKGLSESVHAAALVIGEAGILLRGPAGAGKTSLALDLIARARMQGRFARLVADDRVVLRERGGRILLAAPETIAGRVEIRGAGIAQVAHLSVALLRLIVDLDEDAPRYPEIGARSTMFFGVPTPRLVIRRDLAAQAVAAMLDGGFGDTWMSE
jgi:HPr kinase/phosphorylase